ncbi:ABC transporter ATP-binding protein [Plantactinospora sonchi]|uniref:ABC transporter ATP-binding protein n=1 Tax=Plantactinospora sonchi TaxID=1544735 RepID=A0ABU7S0C6_9ACTN
MAGSTDGPGVDRATVRLGVTGTARHLAAAMRLCWSAAPGVLLTQLLLTVLAGVWGWVAALLTRAIVDRLTAAPAAPDASLMLLAVGLGALGIAVGAEAAVSRYLDAALERALRVVVTTRLYGAVNRMSGLARLEQPQFQDRIQLAMNAGRAGPGQIVTGAFGIVQGVLTFAGFVGALLAVAPVMVAVVCAAVVPTLWVEVALGRRRAAMTWRISHAERREAFYSTLLSSLEAAKELRLFRLGDFFAGRLLRELTHINREQRAVDRRAFAGHMTLAVLGSVIAAAGLVWAIGLAGRGRLTAGDVTLFIAAVAGTQAALTGTVTQYGLVQQALLLFDHYRAVVAEPADLPVRAAPLPCPSLRVGLELRDVWFRYADDQPWILRGVTLTIPAGKSVALVGLNGAGKSTLVKLLCRFYDPVRGSIHWDGVDLRDLDPGELRDRLGVVFQDFMSYDLTAAENIGVGDVARIDDPAAIEHAARLAGCHDPIARLPRGYDTFLSRLFFADPAEPETGTVLSGGQWQRVAVARALLRAGRDVLILDEPSSGLDAEAEYTLHAHLRDLRQGRTSILISHRLSTVREADRIVVLESGNVVECGRHADLMAAGGRYATLFGLQARGYRDGDGDGTAPSPVGGLAW